MVIVFNWYGAFLMGAALIAFFAGVPLLGAFGLDSQESGEMFVGAIGAAVLAVDYRLRRRNKPVSPMWRLLDPRAGGHIFVVPCWIIGASLVLLGFVGLGDYLREWYPGLPREIHYLGFVGFLVPAAGDYLYPFTLGSSQHTDPEKSTPLEPS